MTTDNSRSTSNVNFMSLADTLLAYSEWLDSEHLIESNKSGDQRTHEDLAAMFISYWQENPDRALLAGYKSENRPPDVSQAAWSMYAAAQTILETGGAVEIGGVRITRAEDTSDEVPIGTMMDTLSEMMGSSQEAHHRLEAARLVAGMVAVQDEGEAANLQASLDSIAYSLAGILEKLDLDPQPTKDKKSKKGKRR